MNLLTNYQNLNKAQLIVAYNWLKSQKEKEVLTDLQQFIPSISKNYEAPAHLKPLTNELNSILQGETNKRICVSVAPRHGKTETILHFIAAYLRTHPGKVVAYTSYAQTQSESKTLNCIDYCKLAGLESSEEMANRKEYRFKNGSKLITTSIQGRIEGEGVDIFIIDDPYSGMEAAESRVQRDSIWNWYENVCENRLEPNGSIIVCMHRWHLDDLVGRLLKDRPRYKYIRLPALCDSIEDLNNREIGEALWESRWTKEMLLEKQKDGKHTFSTEYQGIPLSDEDRLIKGAYFYDELPEGLSYNVAADLAYSTGEKNDNSALIVMGKKYGSKTRYIIEVSKWKTPLLSKDNNDSITRLLNCYDKYHTAVGLEKNGVQKGIFDTVKMYFSHIKENKITGDKLVRARAFMDAWNQGEILVPKQATWLNDYLNELYDFTGLDDVHDDQVDVSAYAYNDSLTAGLSFKSMV